METINVTIDGEEVTFEVGEYLADGKADVYAIPLHLYIGLVEKDGNKVIALGRNEYRVLGDLSDACVTLFDMFQLQRRGGEPTQHG